MKWILEAKGFRRENEIKPTTKGVDANCVPYGMGTQALYIIIIIIKGAQSLNKLEAPSWEILLSWWYLLQEGEQRKL